MRHTPRPQVRSAAHGFMLIEVLVSVLIFSVGVLALVGLQANMNQAQAAAKVRTDAAYLASELTGIMWADKAHLSSYQTANCENYPRCKAWKAKVAQALPNGLATVTVVSGDITIVITWSLPDGDPHQYNTETSIS